MKKTLAFCAAFILVGALIPLFSFADTPLGTGSGGGGTPLGVGSCGGVPLGTGSGGGTGLPNPLKASNLTCFIKQVVDVVLRFAEIIAALLIIWSGFLFVKARGNEGELETARRNFFYVIIGTAILLAAHVITDIIINTINQLRA